MNLGKMFVNQAKKAQEGSRVEVRKRIRLGRKAKGAQGIQRLSLQRVGAREGDTCLGDLFERRHGYPHNLRLSFQAPNDMNRRVGQRPERAIYEIFVREGMDRGDEGGQNVNREQH